MFTVISLGKSSDHKPAREHKGDSLLQFPADYVVVDIETTGLDTRWDEIIELAALRIRDGRVCDSFSTLVKPENEIDDFITELTGITNEDLADAPALAEVLPAFLSFLGEDIIAGHNVHFDVNFIYDASMSILGRPVSNDTVDTMRISRYVLPELEHHRLSDVAKALGVIPEGAHRALVDCKTTYQVLEEMREFASRNGIDLSSIQSSQYHGVRASDIVASEGKARPDSVLFGKVCVFTGTLEKMTRREAMQAVADLGGICADGVTAKTNFLILGNNDYCQSIKDGKSNKQKKAESLILKGKDLQILSETVFYELIAEE